MSDCSPWLTTTILKPDATHMILRRCSAGWCTEWVNPDTDELVAATRPSAGCICGSGKNKTP